MKKVLLPSLEKSGLSLIMYMELVPLAMIRRTKQNKIPALGAKN
jgi:hypothetical protein